MADINFSFDNMNEEQIYSELKSKLNFLFPKTDSDLSKLSNFTALLKQSFGKISWVGFYFFDGFKLHLGPFQGKIACTQIDFGKGVCGSALKERKTFIVDNVNTFPGHIACDADSKSEIVVPIISGNDLYGVLDIDSYRYAAFNQIDKKFLEDFTEFLVAEINFKKIIYSLFEQKEK